MAQGSADNSTTAPALRESPSSISPGLAIRQGTRPEALQGLRRLRNEARSEIDRLLALLDANFPRRLFRATDRSRVQRRE
jgi:hypothetical protein